MDYNKLIEILTFNLSEIFIIIRYECSSLVYPHFVSTAKSKENHKFTEKIRFFSNWST